MLVPIVCAALTGAGLWLVVRGLTPAPPGPAPSHSRRPARRPWRAWSAALAARLALADLPVTPARFALAGLGLSLASALLVLALTGLWLLALAAAVGAAWLLATWLALRAGDRARRVDLDLEVAIGQMGGLIAEAGAGLVTTLDGLAARGPASLRPAFAEASSVARADGLPAGLAALRRRLGPGADALGEALALADAHGFDRLTRLLPRLADAHREARRTRATITALQNGALVQANALTAMPFAAILIIRVAAPADFSDVWQTPLGAAGLVAIVGLVLAGRLLLRWVGRVDGLRRARPADAPPPTTAHSVTLHGGLS
jgi:Flp pilus assembly protein TadB